MSFLTTYFNHAAAVQTAANAMGLVAHTDLSDFSLRLQRGAQSQRWRARFVALLHGRLAYVDRITEGTFGFAGWMPYEHRQWPIAIDKSAFKHRAIARDIKTPAACFDPTRIGGPFIIKKASSSFGEGIRGPFLAYDANDPSHGLKDGEYYENFIPGHIAKAWCWGGECVAIELHEPGVARGDGQHSTRELVARLPNSRRGEHDWAALECLARYCGVPSLDQVLPAGKEVMVEFKYGSRYDTLSRDNANAIRKLRGVVKDQFEQAAAIFALDISSDPLLRQSLFTLDALVDSQGAVWFLEMNCNPLVHPDAYRSMIAGAFPQLHAPREEDLLLSPVEVF